MTLRIVFVVCARTMLVCVSDTALTYCKMASADYMMTLCVVLMMCLCVDVLAIELSLRL